MKIISGERLQQLADVALVDSGNKNNIIYSKQYFNINCDNLNDNQNMKLNLFLNANIIYVKTDYLMFFEQRILPHITKDFVLITHNSDYTVGSKHLSILNNKKLIKWYGMNIDVRHKKLFSLPIGLANSQWQHGQIHVLEHVMNKTRDTPKSKLLYVNFTVDTNRKVRIPVKKIFMDKGYDFTHPNLTSEEYLFQLAEYKFAISPEGNGPDCHRIWECLYLGVIPIVTNTQALVQFKDLRILFVDDWNQISDDFLNEQYLQINSKTWNNQKLDVDYWSNVIQNNF